MNGSMPKVLAGEYLADAAGRLRNAALSGVKSSCALKTGRVNMLMRQKLLTGSVHKSGLNWLDRLGFSPCGLLSNVYPMFIITFYIQNLMCLHQCT